MDFYKLLASRYDELYGGEQGLKLNIIKQELDIKRGDLLLDVGCGTHLPEFKCKVIGIDPSIELLLQYAPLEHISNMILSRAENIPFKDNTFDKVISVTSMHNFGNLEKGIEEIKRVGRGYFAFSILKKAKHFDLIEARIKKHFSIKKIIDGRQDWIFICSKIFK